MNDAVLIQHAHALTDPKADPFYISMLDLTRSRNDEYCADHGFDYWCEVYNDERYPAITGAWLKIQLMLKAIAQGYRYIVWLDTDALIWDTETDLRDAIQPGHIGACWQRIPQFPQGHWNVGVLYADRSPEVGAFLSDWLGAYPAPPDGWNEQGVFNRMGRKSRVVVTLSDRWNATLDVSMVPDAVVLGYHGQGNAARRFELMKKTLQVTTAPQGVGVTISNEIRSTEWQPITSTTSSYWTWRGACIT